MNLTAQAYDVCNRVARSLNSELPPGFRGVLRIVVDGAAVKAENVTIEFRPPQMGQRKA